MGAGVNAKRPSARLSVLLAGAAAVHLACVAAPAFAQSPSGWTDPPVGSAAPMAQPDAAVRAALRESYLAGHGSHETASFYRDRGYAPLWTAGGAVRPEARRLAEVLTQDGADREHELLSALEAAEGSDAVALARAEIALSDALAARRAPAGEADGGLAFIDTEIAPVWLGGAKALEAAAKASSLATFVDEASRRNPLQEALSKGLERYRASWGSLPEVKVAAGPVLAAGATGVRVKQLRRRLGLPEAGAYDTDLEAAVSNFQAAHGLAVSGRADAATLAALNAGPWRYEQMILASLERAKALPPSLGERYILVNAPAGELKLYDGGQMVKRMKVVVGKPTLPTPMMAGVLRYAVFNPYWNVPEDLVQTTIAHRVLTQGLGYLDADGMEVFESYEPDARKLDPAAVDWRGVAAGTVSVRVRQKPGPKNMMGQVKLAFPNPLGIYLHDTPMKELFGLDQRTASSGCVRLEDAMALTELLMDGEAEALKAAAANPETPAPLPKAVPVYITYLTAEPTEDGFIFRPDVYGRDKAWSAQLARRHAAEQAQAQAGVTENAG
ncbi:L,D-transpeptidase family protein [Phenylobacterium deserti]|uniref:Murein L,D-transpeptidase n=1 Tax=Phenylobacterium deserti TaxID=1914756 RepID=A0A328ADC9_9CAUL|nr:L,D-transpeptidase family protein [Phenylobacterium deserti]RAK52595.1 murein L,D-transpeptidase [Phenylobacterium deserti]